MWVLNPHPGISLITMDGDLQDDPNEFPRLLDKINEGFDLVSGWKKCRHDPFHKVLASRVFNFITRSFSGIKLHDFNCGYKAYRREVLEKIDLYGELHRFIPVLAARYGYKITEIQVKHHQRRYGKSKFGIERYFRGIIDLLTVLTLTNYHQKPSHLFTGVGILFGVIGTLSLSYLIILWFVGQRPIGNRPLLFFGILAIVLAVQLISLGILSEMMLQNMRKDSVTDYIQEAAGFEVLDFKKKANCDLLSFPSPE
jgi:glycosyltransferase involved in cell wall biosynthesis